MMSGYSSVDGLMRHGVTVVYDSGYSSVDGLMRHGVTVDYIVQLMA